MQQKKNSSAQQFGIALREWRAKAGKNLRDLAIKTGMSFTYLAKIERGELPPPSEDKLRRLAKMLRRPENELLNAAGRLPADVIQIAQRHPSRYSKLLRATKKLSQTELDRVINRALLEAAKILREKRHSKRQSGSGGR